MAPAQNPDAPPRDIPLRILMGPGPSMMSPRALAAMNRPVLGYLDRDYLTAMEHLQDGLRYVFGTENAATFAVTGSGTAGMECALFNVVEPGDRALICVSGFFGDRMRQILERAGAEVHVIEPPQGQPVSPEAVAERLRELDRVQVVALVHGETSTGVLQPVEPIARLAREHGALVVLDTVATLGGVAVETDRWGVDVAYAAGQKCLSAPPGIAPITFSERAVTYMRQRRQPCQSWYLDALLNLVYWDRPHAYHHTGPTHLTYGLLEAVTLIREQGLDRRVAHHRAMAEALWAGLEGLGLRLPVAPEHRLPSLTTVWVPDGIDEAAVRADLLNRYGIDFAGGLGELKGRIWRVGLMGESSRRRHVLLFLETLEEALTARGRACETGAGVAAAVRCFEQREQALLPE